MPKTSLKGVNKLTDGFKTIYRFALVLVIGFLLLLTIVACSSTPTPRNASLTVEYNGKLVHEAKPENKGDLKPAQPQLIFNTTNDLKLALESKTRPLIIIYSANWCKPCHVVNQKLIENKARAKVLVLNIDEFWVQSIALEFNIRGVPTMHVLAPNNRVYTFEGANTIINTVLTILQ